MQFSDRILANQIKQFTEGLRSLESNLNGAREDFVKFAAETKTRGTPLFGNLICKRGKEVPDHVDISTILAKISTTTDFDNI